jgi:hypothetical protein
MLKFRAMAVSTMELPDLNSFVVVLAEGRDGRGRRLEIQRALAFDQQDRSLGQDTYCLCTEEGAAHYGGIIDWTLTGGELRVALDDERRQTSA